MQTKVEEYEAANRCLSPTNKLLVCGKAQRPNNLTFIHLISRLFIRRGLRLEGKDGRLSKDFINVPLPPTLTFRPQISSCILKGSCGDSGGSVRLQGMQSRAVAETCLGREVLTVWHGRQTTTEQVWADCVYLTWAKQIVLDTFDSSYHFVELLCCICNICAHRYWKYIYK